MQASQKSQEFSLKIVFFHLVLGFAILQLTLASILMYLQSEEHRFANFFGISSNSSVFIEQFVAACQSVSPICFIVFLPVALAIIVRTNEYYFPISMAINALFLGLIYYFVFSNPKFLQLRLEVIWYYYFLPAIGLSIIVAYFCMILNKHGAWGLVSLITIPWCLCLVIVYIDQQIFMTEKWITEEFSQYFFICLRSTWEYYWNLDVKTGEKILLFFPFVFVFIFAFIIDIFLMLLEFFLAIFAVLIPLILGGIASFVLSQIPLLFMPKNNEN